MKNQHRNELNRGGTRLGHFSSDRDPVLSLSSRDEYPRDEMSAQDGRMSYQEIVHRFKKVFGREMTPAERHMFFLDVPSSGKEPTEP
jgi:hypothetical protein